VLAYRDEGIVPQALRNFLALLGWTAPEGTPEILGDAELIHGFGLDGISRSNAVFDRAKLDWFNTEYIRSYPPEKLLPLIEQEWGRAGFKPDPSSAEYLLAAVRLLQPRARSLRDFATSFRGFFKDHFTPDSAAVKKFLPDREGTRRLAELGGRYAGLSGDFDEEQAETTLRKLAEEEGVKAGVLINGARVALTGQAVAPSLFAVMILLGKQKTIARLQSAAHLAANRNAANEVEAGPAAGKGS
jgi:glutamyl-tRNA synthetase